MDETFRFLTEAPEIEALLTAFETCLPSLGAPEAPGRFAEKFSAHARVCVLEGEKILGFAAFYDNDTAGKTAYLSMIAVDPGCRGRGAGERLLTFAERTAARHGMQGLRLEVRGENTGALRFYTRLGYTPAGSSETGSYLYKKFEEGV